MFEKFAILCIFMVVIKRVNSDSVHPELFQPRIVHTTVTPATVIVDELDGHPNWALLPVEGVCGEYGRLAPAYSSRAMKLLPWMALIRIANAEGVISECTGTVISARYVLTAATCVTAHNVTGVEVILGEYNETGRSAEWRENHSVEHTTLHADYSIDREMSLTNNDIALLRLKEPVKFDDETYTRPICLPLRAGQRKQPIENRGYNGRMVGWQKIVGQNESTLNRIKVPILDPVNCTAAYQRSKDSDHNPTENKICAGVEDPDPEFYLEIENTCNFSAGSPMMTLGYYDTKIYTYQFAVSSLHHKECESGVPSLYVDLRKYMKWILETIKP